MVICCSRLLLTKICSSLGMPGAEGPLGGRAALIIMQSCEPHHCSSLLPTGLGLQSTYQVLDIKTLASFSVFHKDQPWFNRSQGKILRSETFRSLNLAPKMHTPWRRMWSLRSAWLCPPSLLPFEPSPQCGIAHQGLISDLVPQQLRGTILSFPTATAASSPHLCPMPEPSSSSKTLPSRSLQRYPRAHTMVFPFSAGFGSCVLVLHLCSGSGHTETL